MALLPLVGAVVSVFMFGRWYYLIMAVMSPIMLFGNYFNDKKHGRKSHAKQRKEYQEHKERIEEDAQEALVQERTDRRQAVPDPAAVLATGTGPRTRLWERRRTDADHLLLRFGTGRVPSEVELDDPEQDEHKRKVRWYIEDAPVALPLKNLGVIGVAGPGDSAHALGRWAVAQTAVLHSPMDVQFYVLTDNDANTRWDWVRWLPHARPASGQDVNVLIGTDSETVGARVGELTQLLDGRQKALQQGGKSKTDGPAFSDPDIVVVWDGSRRLRSMPGVVRLLREGPAVAIYAICLDEEERFLPGECQAFVVAEPRRTDDDSNSPPPWPSSPPAASPPSRPGTRPRSRARNTPSRPPSCGSASSRPGRCGRRTYGPTSSPRPGAHGWPGPSPRCATSAASPRTPRCPAPAGCWTCCSWSRPRATRSPRAGGWAAVDDGRHR